MRIALALLVALALALGTARCGGGEDTSANQSTEPDTTVQTTPTGTDGTTTDDDDDGDDDTTGGTTTDDDEGAGGDADNGRELFAANGCGSCHALEAAGSSGGVGPNLDETEPSFDKAVERVTNGRGAMPSFSDTLSDQEIRDVAAFVSEAADS